MGEKDKPVQCPKCYTVNPEDSQLCSKCGFILKQIPDTLSYIPYKDTPSDKFIQFNPGDMFDNRYRIVEEIGRGGMGRIYKAEDTSLNITVALKIIRSKYSSNPLFIEQFKKETLTARSISHKNVIRIYDLGEAQRIKYISMEYIKGPNLSEFIHTSGSLSIATAINITHQICEALKAAHQKGIVHQDLKPSNIMIDSSGQTYVMDFGLARPKYIQEADTSEGISGTPQYMAPEQARGEKVDQRSDIYSFGIIMYEMLTGKPPFEANTTKEYLHKQVAEIPKPPSKLNPNIPHLLEHIIIKCLEKDSDNRYQSADEILVDVNKMKLELKPLSFPGRLKKYKYVAIAAVLLFFMVTSIYLWINKSISPLTKSERISMAIMYFVNNTGDDNLDYMGKTFCELVIADMLQSQYIRVITGDRLYAILKKLNLHKTSTYSSEDLSQVAALGGVDYILQGNITQAGKTFRINTSLHEARTMELIGAERVEGTGRDSIFSMVDQLTRRIKEAFQLSAVDIAQDTDKDVMSITTNSPEALKYYIDGKLLYEESEFQESINALEKAIALDPEFALAYVKISQDYYYMGNTDQGDKYLTRALSLLNKVSEREYHLIQAYAAYSPQMEMEHYQKLLELYPDDLEGNGYLAARYRNWEEWDLAQERFEMIMEIDPREELTYENLAYIYMAKGLYDKARNILISNQPMLTNLVSYHNNLATIYLCEGQYEFALDEINKALSLEPDDYLGNELQGNIYQITGNYKSAEKTYRQLIEGDDFLYQYMGRLWLSHVYLMRGEYTRLKNDIVKDLEHFNEFNFKPGLFNFRILSVYILLQNNLFAEALEESTKAMEVAEEAGYHGYKNFALLFRGIVYAKMKKYTEARETADKLKKHIEESTKNKSMRYYHHLIGEIARTEGDISVAIKEFKTAVSLLSPEHTKLDVHILFHDSLASVLFENRDFGKALKEYEKITSLSTGRLRWGDKYSLSFYWLGKIHQIQGKTDKAIEFYNKFLEIWTNADRELPEIAEAKKQLASLNP
jgi:serine/threonine protein kinase/Flp pilus assembly protein TadD